MTCTISLPIHLKLPISFLGNRNISEVSSVVLGIGAAKDQFTPRGGIWIPRKEQKKYAFLESGIPQFLRGFFLYIYIYISIKKNLSLGGKFKSAEIGVHLIAKYFDYFV